MNVPIPYSNEQKFGETSWCVEDLTRNYDVNDEEALEILMDIDEIMIEAMDEVAVQIIQDGVAEYIDNRSSGVDHDNKG